MGDVVDFVSDAGRAAEQAARDTANAIMTGVQHVSPIIDHVIDPFDILPDAIRIPGTDIYLSPANILFTWLIGIPPIGFIPIRRNDEFGFESEITFKTLSTNPYLADLKLYVNNANSDRIAFQTPATFSSQQEVQKYFIEENAFNYIDACITLPNSTIQLIFNTENFDKSDGFVNVNICYLGDDETCNCRSSNEDAVNTIGVGFSRIDPQLTYPVSCHGMVYTGTKDSGLSTGGRCEKRPLYDAESKITEKYGTKYSTVIDDSLDAYELEKSRVLDLVYKYNGTTWIKQQNLLESVYYHTGVGDDKHSIFFGGIHDTITNYSFSYNNNINLLPIPKFEDFDFTNKITTAIITQKLYGMHSDNSLAGSTCWNTPAWQVPSNFDQDPYMIMDNPTYTPSISTNYMGFIRDPDFPPVNFTSIQPNSSFEFGNTVKLYKEVVVGEMCVGTVGSGGWGGWGGSIFGGIFGVGGWDGYCTAYTQSQQVTEVLPEAISGSNVTYTYPSIDVMQISANFEHAYKNSFLVKAQTATISGTIVDFVGEVKINNIKLNYDHKMLVYPNDIAVGTISGEKKYFTLKSINSNSENINLVGAFQHQFNYTSTKDSTTRPYANRGLFTLRFNSLNNIRDGIKSKSYVKAVQNFTVVDASTFPISAAIINGGGEVYFDINEHFGVMVGVESKNYNWVDGLENSDFDIASTLNINASIGTSNDERWGVPLWASVFTDNANYLGHYKFNSRLESSDANRGKILHEITNIDLSSNSIMSLANNRIFVAGNTVAQDHKYTCLNGIKTKGYWNIASVKYNQNSIGQLYSQIPNLIINSNCLHTSTPTASLSNISGTITSSGSECCNVIHSFTSPYNVVLNSIDASPTLQSDGQLHIHAYYDYIDGCIWKIVENSYTPGDVLQTNSFDYIGSCLWTCADMVVKNDLEGSVTNETGDIFNFNSPNFVHMTTLDINPTTKLISHDLLDSTKWKVDSITSNITNDTDCTLSIVDVLSYIPGSNFASGTPAEVVVNNVTGSVLSIGDICCSGNFQFPDDFTWVSTYIAPITGSDLYANLVYKLSDCTNVIGMTISFNLIAKHNGTVETTIVACPAGTFDIDITTCQAVCENTLDHVNNVLLFAPTNGKNYAEYATNFIQEYKDDNRYKVPEYIVTTNANGITTENKGIFVPSYWKRYMDGTGLGGDAPNYDSIYEYNATKTKPLINWSEIGYWNIGQMSFGDPNKAIIVGGHKVSRDVGKTLIGSGIHGSTTSKRVYIWNTATISNEDSYLKNYYGRRFNTYYHTSTLPISSNQNKSDLNCIIFDAQSDIVVERLGNIKFDGTKNVMNVTFDTPMTADVGTNYSISLTSSDNVKVWWESKTVTGFLVKCELSTWEGEVSYLATAIVKVTEEDLTQKTKYEGYTFDK